jgi:DNA-binding MarR family transcriptional regulator
MKEKESAIESLFGIFCLSRKNLLEYFAKKDQKITKTQFYILLVAYHDQNLSMSQIASAISSSKEQTTRAVTNLEEAGYLRRHHDDKNRRVVHVELTDTGLEMIRQIRQNMIEGVEERMGVLSEEEVRDFDAAAHTVRKLLMKITAPVNI